LDYLKKKLTEWFDKQPRVYGHDSSTYVLEFNSKKIYRLLCDHLSWMGKKTYSVHLRDLNLANVSFNLGFLRGLLDTDGNYYPPKRRLTFATVSPILAQQTQAILAGNLCLKYGQCITKKGKKSRLLCNCIAWRKGYKGD